VGLRVGLDRCGNFPQTVQPVGSRYTDYATRPRVGMYRRENLTCTDRSPDVPALSKSLHRLCYPGPWHWGGGGVAEEIKKRRNKEERRGIILRRNIKVT